MTTETAAARNESGQFTANTDAMFGAELENHKAGFSTKPRDPPPEEAADGVDAVRQAADGLAARRRQEAVPLSATDVESLNPDRDQKQAVTIKQAADEYAQAKTAVSTFADGIDFGSLADKVDADRERAVDGDKDRAKHFGLELEEGTKETKTKTETPAKPPVDDQVDAETAAAIDSVEGLDETTKRALKIPQVRAAIEQQLGEVDNARQQLATERALAQQFAQASFMEGFPELAGLPPPHLEAGLQQLAQQNPQRFAQAMGVLGRVQHLQAAAQQDQAVKAQEERAQIETWAKGEDARLKAMGVEFTTQVANEVVEYAEELGLSREQLGNAMLAHPILRSAEFQRVMFDASRYRQTQKAKATINARPLPPVQRPGMRQETPRPEAGNLAGLQRQLDGAVGNRALRIAAQIKSAQRKARS